MWEDCKFGATMLAALMARLASYGEVERVDDDGRYDSVHVWVGSRDLDACSTVDVKE